MVVPLSNSDSHKTHVVVSQQYPKTLHSNSKPFNKDAIRPCYKATMKPYQAKFFDNEPTQHPGTHSARLAKPCNSLAMATQSQCP